MTGRFEAAARRLLAGCRVKAHDGTMLYTPDGKGNYRALWTRDFAYMVENAGGLIPPAEVEACLRFLLRGQRGDGAIPDRVQPDGAAVYVAGSPEHPLGLANLDNPAFLVIATSEHLMRLPADHAGRLFTEWGPSLDRAMAWVPRSGRGLVFNDPRAPHSPYGFTDTVAKTGELFMESLLDWTASRRMAALHARAGKAESGAVHERRSRLIEENLAALWDERAGAFLAASQDCRQIDVWGNAYAIYLNFPLGPRRDRVLRFLRDNLDRYTWRGQVRHLLKGQFWEKQLAPVPPGRYQNGAYWATASGWVITALWQTDPARARAMAAELDADFRSRGVYECVAEDHRQLESYVVSAANPLGALRRLGWKD